MMESIKRCSRCLIPKSLENVTFDQNGVCSHCRKYEQDFADWEKISDRRKQEFEQILNAAKSLKRPYDCLVPLSGGKDSTYTLYLATRIYKLKTLAVTLDNGYLSQAAKDNIRNALQHCDADHVFYAINRANSTELFKEFVKRTGDFCNACMRGINYSIEMAVNNFKIPLVIKGSGRRVQYISQMKGLSHLNTPSYYENVLRGTEAHGKYKYLAGHKYKLEFQKIMGGIADVAGFSRLLMMRFFPQHIGLYDYIYLPFPEIAAIIKKEMGWSDSSKTVEHLDCEMHDVPMHMMSLARPELGPNTLYYSGLIRQGIMSREKALAKDEAERTANRIPPELEKFLQDNNLTYGQYVKFATTSDRGQFEPRLQVLARDIYHKLRKY
ncbi:MAG: hypothetical protein R6V77_07640 [Candidatus Cloacimonadaceae bacterium]